jgi:hypothetical protein
MSSDIKNNEILEMIINDMNYQETLKLQEVVKEVNSKLKSFISMTDCAEDMNVYVEDSVSIGNIIVKYIITNMVLSSKAKKFAINPDINFMIKFYNAEEVMNFKGSGMDHYLNYEEWEEIYDLFEDIITSHIDILKRLGEDKKIKPKKKETTKKKSSFSIANLGSLFKPKKYDDDDEYYDEDEYYDDDDEYYDD